MKNEYKIKYFSQRFECIKLNSIGENLEYFINKFKY